MSADNFYFITRHPLGGYAVLMGFASFDEPLVATAESMRFDSLPDAITYANEEYSEYGVQISNDVLVDLDPKTPANPEIAKAVVGLAEVEAIKAIEAAGFRFRITQRDENYFVATRDYRTDRVTLKVKEGLVFSATIG